MSAIYRLQILSVTMGGALPTLGASIASNTAGASDTLTLSAPLVDGQGFQISVADPNYLPIVVDPNTANAEVMWITSLAAGATTATVTRAAEGLQIGQTGLASSHLIGAAFVHAATPQDFLPSSVEASLYAWATFQ